MVIRYVFSDEPLRIKAKKDAKPQVIGKELTKLAAANGGALTPDAVVESAKAESSPIHQHFEWDDSIAAHAHRLEQARSLIRVIRVADHPTADGPARAFLSIHDSEGIAYRTLSDVRESPDFQRALLRQADSDLAGFQRRYRALKEICEAVEPVREKIRQKVGGTENETRASV